MNERSKEFLKTVIKYYYKNTKIPPPKEFEKREFAFENFDGSFIRHIAFSDYSDFQRFAVEHAPKGIYYSSAMYVNPGEEDMTEKKKGWLGAELVFDLDADHIQGVENLSYEESLNIVKKDLYKLLGILMDDFGFGEKDIEIVFSGRRGYHIHIFSERINKLSSDARREIINYMTLMNITPDKFFEEIVYGAKVDKRPWLRRFCEYLSSFASSVKEDPQLLMDKLKEVGLKKVSITKCMKELESEWQGRKIIDYIVDKNFKFLLEKQNLTTSTTKKRKKKGKKKELYIEKCLRNIFHAIWKDFLEEYLPHPDEPVSTDITRLIRLPYSIHGKTFLRVVPVNMEDLKYFNPLREAVIESLKNIQVRIEVLENTEIKIGGNLYKLSKGILDIDALAGIYAICNNKAEIIKYNLSEIKSLLFR